jgi:hypothetical protein
MRAKASASESWRGNEVVVMFGGVDSKDVLKVKESVLLCVARNPSRPVQERAVATLGLDIFKRNHHAISGNRLY